ncbi:MAG TPA: glycosyltransferase family 2 protein [Cyclobacteriaceae bacterium]
MIVLEIILLSYFTFVSLYAFILSFAALFYNNKSAPQSTEKRRIAVLIPSYKEDQVIVSVAQSASKQNYPQDKFDVVVIADSLKDSTMETLHKLPIRVVKATFEKSTKVKALNLAMATIGDDYDCALILDADNIMEPDFLNKMNNYFGAGHKAIQAQRSAKNKNNPMAFLDGLSEAINNFVYRQGHVAVGLSCSLIGSGMIFEYRTLKEILLPLDSIGGFDRELELNLIKRKIKIHYAKDTVVYDEKVDSTEVFEKQRTRWLSSQFLYLKKYFFDGWLGLLKGQLDYFNSSILKNIQLPRVVNLGLLFIFTIIAFILSAYLHFPPTIWLIFIGLNFFAVLFATPKSFYSKEMIKSLQLIPGLFFKMFMLLFKLKGANKTFIHTPHSHTTESSDQP